MFACSLLGDWNTWSPAGDAIGDLNTVLFEMLFGLAARRPDGREFLVDFDILNALRIVLAFTFIFAALGKALSIAPMTEFFIGSGYPVSFLKFIVIAEAFGAIGLLLPWAVMPALIGLSIDMFGAVLTHINNGDSLNDSTGAIALLIRLLALGFLWTLRARVGEIPRSLHRTILRWRVITIVCILVAGAGGTVVRHLNASVPRTSNYR
jgi:uncharacterized membrane protein YphA (DoxX/SURF4 family)